jgi:hypothetical protein
LFLQEQIKDIIIRVKLMARLKNKKRRGEEGRTRVWQTL